ncbi:DinB family protein [Geodermatophilus sp. URMC 64]
MSDRAVLPLLLGGWDDAWGRLDRRLDGLTDDEYLWEPVAGAWTVRRTDAGWRADRVHPDPDPAPVTTIAWRIWHLASDALASYLDRSPAGRPLAVTGTDWHPDAGTALRDLRTAAAAFRDHAVALGEDGIWQPLGPAWGPYAEASWAALVVHAFDELAHHGAEIALLRDLYRAQAASR